MELGERRELIDDGSEFVELHRGERPVRRPILAELDRAHFAAQVALSDRLDLDICRQFHGLHLLRLFR